MSVSLTIRLNCMVRRDSATTTGSAFLFPYIISVHSASDAKIHWVLVLKNAYPIKLQILIVHMQKLFLNLLPIGSFATFNKISERQFEKIRFLFYIAHKDPLVDLQFLGLVVRNYSHIKLHISSAVLKNLIFFADSKIFL